MRKWEIGNEKWLHSTCSYHSARAQVPSQVSLWRAQLAAGLAVQESCLSRDHLKYMYVDRESEFAAGSVSSWLSCKDTSLV